MAFRLLYHQLKFVFWDFLVQDFMFMSEEFETLQLVHQQVCLEEFKFIFCGSLQAHAPSSGYFLRLDKSEDDTSVRKRDKMRKWLCCTCQVEESYPPHESEQLKSPRNYSDGMYVTYIFNNGKLVYPLNQNYTCTYIYTHTNK